MSELNHLLNPPQEDRQKISWGCKKRRLPEWLKKPIRRGNNYTSVVSRLSANRLHTVCVEARCPNRAECFSDGTATFLIMGNVCTRNCGFCMISHGNPLPLDDKEPERIADAAENLNLHHIVITSVTRDDLPDGGAAHFAECVRQCRNRVPEAAIEILIPDFRGKNNALDLVIDCRPDILSHNVETVGRLYTRIRPQADYQHSLELLACAQKKNITAKSGIMVGLGETDEEVIKVLRDLHAAGCRMVTIGQYLQPSREQTVPQRYVLPEQFSYYEESGRAMGFRTVLAGPYVRSSYHASKVYAQCAALKKVPETKTCL
jgi:lipoyl synthase